MPQALTYKQKEKVLNLYYLGYTNSEINQKSGISTGSISTIIREHKRARQDGEPEDVALMMRKFKESGLSIDDIAESLAFHSKLQRLNLSEKDFEKFAYVYHDA